MALVWRKDILCSLPGPNSAFSTSMCFRCMCFWWASYVQLRSIQQLGGWWRMELRLQNDRLPKATGSMWINLTLEKWPVVCKRRTLSSKHQASWMQCDCMANGTVGIRLCASSTFALWTPGKRGKAWTGNANLKKTQFLGYEILSKRANIYIYIYICLSLQVLPQGLWLTASWCLGQRRRSTSHSLEDCLAEIHKFQVCVQVFGLWRCQDESWGAPTPEWPGVVWVNSSWRSLARCPGLGSLGLSLVPLQIGDSQFMAWDHATIWYWVQGHCWLMPLLADARTTWPKISVFVLQIPVHVLFCGLWGWRLWCETRAKTRETRAKSRETCA